MYSASINNFSNKIVPQFRKICNGFYPYLAVLARLVLVSSTSGTESERLFRTAGLLRNKRRSRFNFDWFETIIKLASHVRKMRVIDDVH